MLRFVAAFGVCGFLAMFCIQGEILSTDHVASVPRHGPASPAMAQAAATLADHAEKDVL